MNKRWNSIEQAFSSHGVAPMELGTGSGRRHVNRYDNSVVFVQV